ncbi:MAG TPA: NfeD family protein [Candidatus Baltobacteraceae bacterium]|nr:NfeD family protein [Candidatus Baltobacteraceae bacterium]
MELLHALNTPLVSAVLLTVGLLGLLLEMQTLHGIAGLLGLGALGLFFGSHIAAGASGPLVIILAILGLAGILWELHVVPGHGAPGVLGSAVLLLSVLLAFGTPMIFVAMQTVATAIVVTIILFYLATRIFPENAWIAKLTFAGAQGADYVTSTDFSSLAGKSGVAASYLRPAGVALVEGQRVDVLTQGEFIPEGTPIRVARVEGARIFVEPITLPSYKE